MLKSKLCLFLCLCLFLGCAEAESPNIISQEMIQTETVNYSKTAVVELGEYKREYSASASEYYPHKQNLSLEVNNANFLKYHVARAQHVQKGDVLATFTLDVDEAAITSVQLSLERAQKNYETGLRDRQDALDELVQAQKSETDPNQRELSALRVKRAKVELEQYCYQQELTIRNLEKQLAELQEVNSQSQLVAPFDGIVDSASYRRIGEKVYANEILGSIYREDDMLLKINNEQLYFRYGMPVTVTSGSKNDQKVYHGTVVAADNLLPESRRKGVAYIQLHDVPAGERLTRLTAACTSEYLDNVLLVPRRAGTMEGGNYYVERLVNGAVQRRFINVGLNNLTTFWVAQGLEAGETVIID